MNRSTAAKRSSAARGKRKIAGKGRKVSRRQSSLNQQSGRKWSAEVMRRSNALDLEPGVFTKRSPRQIALSLKRSALASHRRRAGPFQSAMSMLNFHINRSGKGLTAERRRVLNRAKVELRRLFDRQSAK